MKLHLPLVFVIAIALIACKPKTSVDSAPPPEPAVAAPASPGNSASAAKPAPVAEAAKPFDIGQVPVTSAALPAFPYIGIPAELKGAARGDEVVQFDRIHVVAGNGLRPVEGKISRRYFSINEIGMSPLGAHRNYEAVLKELGATRVDTVSPADPSFIEAHGGELEAIRKKMHLIGGPDRSDEADIPGFEQYLLRTPSSNIWMSFYLFDGSLNLGLIVVEEKALKQSVALMPAEQMATALKKDGHVALYLNFDTDSDVILPDSLPAVDEIAKLLKADPNLKLKVEGHTDTDGDAAHNKQLSLARAQSVVKAVTARTIGATRLQPVGVGAERPLADNKTDEGKARNRRVELVRT
jgi:OOP family OmpA-OmpF porin